MTLDRFILWIGGALLATAWPSQHVAANPVKSRYTTIELSTCAVIKRHADGNTWRCAGLKGYPVSYAEGDLRAFVSFGPAAEKRVAARQTLRSFNTIFETKNGVPARRATIEWRFRQIAGADQPYATIMRVFISGDGTAGEVLVISKVSASQACHMAYVDAKATPQAMALARSAADEMAPSWSCETSPKVLGTPGLAPL
jgi:hypothetical protein